MADDAWSPSSAAPGNGDGMPGAMELVNQVIAEVQKDFAMFLAAGIGMLVLGLVLVPFALIAVYGGMFVGMVPGMMVDDPDLAGLGSVLGMVLGMGLLMLGIIG